MTKELQALKAVIRWLPSEIQEDIFDAEHLAHTKIISPKDGYVEDIELVRSVLVPYKLPKSRYHFHRENNV